MKPNEITLEVLRGCRPAVSVVVPVYGTEAYLPACLTSLLDQSFRDLEVIVVDDASPGDVADAVAQVTGSSERVRVIRHERNRGALAARLTGASAANGQYIAFVDSDDLVENDFLETLLAAAVDAGAEIVECATTFVRQDGSTEICNPKHLTFGHSPRVLPNGSIFAAYLGGGIYHSFYNKLFRADFWRRAVQRISFTQGRVDFGEDLLFIFGILKYCCYFVQVDKALYRYLWRAESITNAGASKGNDVRVGDLYLVYQTILPQLSERPESPELKAQFLRREFADVVQNLLADRDASRADAFSPALNWARDLIALPAGENSGLFNALD